MTSSLVGSEMCIRDSAGMQAVLSLAYYCGCWWKDLAGGCLLSSSAVSEPVSYTHLTLPTICSV
eukprot:4700281-Prorocentrum_lima.AAC.1